ncbi:hypothetical protein R5W24_003244 [Gemmata sp. JC717]|uniref:hypothetical protein n=1 Tax=Gemmata algarum TaxID=2975278 RepID=UPI0021BB3491|nr:hypothetical protein [Gemmata algarum]MDY3554125.1 hypothetical protein [Gemmata algarum]
MRPTLFALPVALVLFCSPVLAQPAPKPLDDKKLVTKVYTVKNLIVGREKGGVVADFDALVKLIFETVSIGEPKSDGTGAQLVERDGGALEVRTTEKVHHEVKDLLEALESLQDLAIDVKTEVFELDAATYRQLVNALPKGRSKSPVLFAIGREVIGVPESKPEDLELPAAALKLLKSGRIVQTSSGRFVNGVDSTVSARKVVIPFKNDPAAISVGTKTSNPLFVKEGFALNALLVVSADRRSVRMKLTESSTAVTGMQKRELFELEGKKAIAQSLDTEDLGTTGSALVADGGAAIFKLDYAPKDKVWVVILKPTLFFQSVEDQLKKEGKSMGPR